MFSTPIFERFACNASPKSPAALYDFVIVRFWITYPLPSKIPAK
jgi:hypothetical protein